jgi:hypothetical protein
VRLLREHRGALDRLATAVLDKETLRQHDHRGDGHSACAARSRVSRGGGGVYRVRRLSKRSVLFGRRRSAWPIQAARGWRNCAQ